MITAVPKISLNAKVLLAFSFNTRIRFLFELNPNGMFTIINNNKHNIHILQSTKYLHLAPDQNIPQTKVSLKMFEFCSNLPPVI